jgi:hypothetical protein
MSNRNHHHNEHSSGHFYWGVKTELSEDGEILLTADRVEFTPSGGVIFWNGNDYPMLMGQPVLALAAGQWSAVYAASIHDGRPIAAEHWDGEIKRGRQ